MAAIDKIYVDSFEKYKLFKDWCKTQPKIKDKYGKETSLINYIFNYTEWEDGAVLPVCNNPYYIDAYLIRNCPFDFIQEELMLSYGKWTQDEIEKAYDVVMKRGGEKSKGGIFPWLSKEDFSIIDGKIFLKRNQDSDYDLIKRGKLYATPYTNKKYKVGKSFKIVQCPQQHYNRPFKGKRWFIHVDIPKDLGYIWYHSKTNTWDFCEEFVISDGISNYCTKYKTIKAIKRAIRKWKLPVGTIVTCTGRYVEDTYKFKIV